jgi:superfamily II DNA/RNA helicase
MPTRVTNENTPDLAAEDETQATGKSDEAGASGFAALGLDPSILAALTALGYEEPTPIQTETIPALIAGKDVLGQAATEPGRPPPSRFRSSSACTSHTGSLEAAHMH